MAASAVQRGAPRILRMPNGGYAKGKTIFDNKKFRQYTIVKSPAGKIHK